MLKVDDLESILVHQPFHRAPVEIVQVCGGMYEPPAMFPHPRHSAADVAGCCAENAPTLEKHRGFLNIEIRPGQMLYRVPQGDDVVLFFRQRQVQEVATGDVVSLAASLLARRRRDVASFRLPVALCEFEEETVGATDFKKTPSGGIFQERAYSSAEIFLQRRFVFEVIQVFVSEKIVALIQLLQISGGELCIRKDETAGWALKNPGVQGMIARIASTKDAQGGGRRIVRDGIIVRCQCSGSL